MHVTKNKSFTEKSKLDARDTCTCVVLHSIALCLSHLILGQMPTAKKSLFVFIILHVY